MIIPSLNIIPSGHNINFPPFKADLYPITNPTCLQNAHGGRWLQFKDSTDVIDKIGEENRPLLPDRCVLNDGKGGGVVLDTAINYTLWAYLKRTESNDYLEYTDGINTYTYENGILVNTTVGTSILSITQLAIISGSNYHQRIYNLTEKSATEINTYFQEHGCKWHTNSMPDDNNFKYHRWLMNEGAGTTCFDSGTNPVKIHGTYFYDDVNEAVDTLHSTTLYPSNIRNTSNLEGYSNNAGVIIPLDKANSDFDVQGNSLQYKGVAKYNAEVNGGWAADFDESSYINTGDISGNTATRLSIFCIPKDGMHGYNGLIGMVIDSDNRFQISRNHPNDILSVSAKINGNIHEVTFPYAARTVYDIDIQKTGNDAEVSVNGVSLGLLGADAFSVINQATLSYIGAFSIDGSSPYTYKWLGGLYAVRLDGVYDYYLNNHSIDSITKQVATWVETEQYAETIEAIQSTKDSLSKTVYLLPTGERIIDPQYPLPIGAIELKGKGYKGVGNIDFSGGITTDALGHLPHLFFLQLCYVGNPYGYPEHFSAGIVPYINYDNPYEWDIELIDWLLNNPDEIQEDVRGYLYMFFKSNCGETLTDQLVYQNKKTDLEQIKINKTGCPTYSGLS